MFQSKFSSGPFFGLAPANWQIVLSLKYELWLHHLKGLFLSFRKIKKSLKLDPRNSSYGSWKIALKTGRILKKHPRFPPENRRFGPESNRWSKHHIIALPIVYQTATKYLLAIKLFIPTPILACNFSHGRTFLCVLQHNIGDLKDLHGQRHLLVCCHSLE